MILSSGPVCDVCGNYILPVDSDERVNPFTDDNFPGQTLHAHNKCKSVVLSTGGDWRNLPQGPYRSAYAEAAERMVDA